MKTVDVFMGVLLVHKHWDLFTYSMCDQLGF